MCDHVHDDVDDDRADEDAGVGEDGETGAASLCGESPVFSDLGVIPVGGLFVVNP